MYQSTGGARVTAPEHATPPADPDLCLTKRREEGTEEVREEGKTAKGKKEGRERGNTREEDRKGEWKREGPGIEATGREREKRTDNVFCLFVCP